ncbi:MAG: ABC transporter permease [Armatimonadia bacterium]
MLFKYAWRGFVRRRTRTSLAIAGITLSIGMLVAVVSISESVKGAIDDSLGAAGADMVIQRRVKPCPFADVKLPKDLAEIDAEVVKRIGALQQVENVSGVLLLWAFHKGHPTVVAGVDPTLKTIGPVRISKKTEEEKAALADKKAEEKTGEDDKSCCAITSGRYLTRYDNRAVMLTEEYAKAFGYKVGDKIHLGPRDLFAVVGLVDLSGSARIAEAEAFIPLKTAQAMYGKGDIVDTIFVALKSQKSIELVSAVVQKWIEPKPNDPPETSITTSNNVDAGTSAVAELTRRTMLGLAALVLLFTFLLIVRNALSTVAERLKEVGLMRALGWRRMDVSRLFMAEELIGGVIGGVAGCLVGWGLAFAFSQFAHLQLPSALSSFPPCSTTQPPLALPLDTTPSVLIFGLGLVAALVIGTLAGLAASHRAARLDPSEALRRL